MPGVTEGAIRELIVSDGGSTDATLEIAEGSGAELVSGGPGRGGQLARGAAAAKGDWLLFLHADTHLAGPWLDGLEAAMETPGKAGYFPLRFRAAGTAPRVVAGWANLRSRVFVLPYGDQGLFISRRLYDEIGGFPDIPLMEDVALARALKGRVSAMAGEARTSAERYEAHGWARRGGRNLLILARYLAGADPEELARAYRR